jgi:hypothetical protein
VWISDGQPGSIHDLAAARRHGVLSWAARAEVEVYADKAYQGAGGTVRTPHKGRQLTTEQQAHNTLVNQLRGPANAASPPSRPGTSSPKSAAAPAESANSPKPSSPSNSDPTHEVGKAHCRSLL